MNKTEPCPSCASLREELKAAKLLKISEVSSEVQRVIRERDAAEAALAQARGALEGTLRTLTGQPSPQDIRALIWQIRAALARLSGEQAHDSVSSRLLGERLSEDDEAPPEGSSDKPEGTR